jgi:cytochrome c biogenesis protein CcmG/thiol:disulfide interchange protein DsbE
MRYLVPAGFFLLLVVFFVGLRLNPSEVPSPLIGKPAPAFELPTLSDPEANFATGDMLGRPALLNVWATWCAGCRVEHEMLMQLSRAGDVPIFGLNYRDERGPALEWLQALGDPYKTVGYDPEGVASLDWGVYGAPETFLLAPDGTVVYKHLGPLDPGSWEEEFVPRIREMIASGGSPGR